MTLKEGEEGTGVVCSNMSALSKIDSSKWILTVGTVPFIFVCALKND